MNRAWRIGAIISACVLAGGGLTLTALTSSSSSPTPTAATSAAVPSSTPSRVAVALASASLLRSPTASTSAPSSKQTVSAAPGSSTASSSQGTANGPVVSPAKPVGYNAHILNQSDQSSYVSLIENGGANSLRDSVYWQNVEPTQGTFDWSQPDDLVTEAATHHLHALLVIGAAPTWASGVPQAGQNQLWLPPASAATYGAFAGQVAARYGAGGTFWKANPDVPEYLPAGLELWNEENSASFWGGQSPDPQFYTSMVQDAYTSIKQADPGMTVVLGGLASFGGYNDVACTGRNGTGSTSTESNPLNYLQSLYADGIHGYFDAVGWHPYDFSNGATAAEMLSYNLCSGWSQLDSTPVSARSLMTANGDADKQVWITEVGVPNCVTGATYECVSPDQGAALATQEAQTWQGLSWAGGFYWYEIRDEQLGTQNMGSYFGAVSASGSSRQVYQALQQLWG